MSLILQRIPSLTFGSCARVISLFHFNFKGYSSLFGPKKTVPIKMTGREELDKIGNKLVLAVPGGEVNVIFGIGLEELGVHEFIAGKFFAGELYLDTKQEQYRALGFKKFNICNIWYHMFNRVSRAIASKGQSNKVGGNLKGQGFQTGGTLIVEKGGTNVLLSYKMQTLADHLENDKILAALGIQADPAITSEPRKDSTYSGHNTD